MLKNRVGGETVFVVWIVLLFGITSGVTTFSFSYNYSITNINHKLEDITSNIYRMK